MKLPPCSVLSLNQTSPMSVYNWNMSDVTWNPFITLRVLILICVVKKDSSMRIPSQNRRVSFLCFHPQHCLSHVPVIARTCPITSGTSCAEWRHWSRHIRRFEEVMRSYSKSLKVYETHVATHPTLLLLPSLTANRGTGVASEVSQVTECPPGA